LVGATLLPSIADLIVFNNGIQVPNQNISIVGNEIVLSSVLVSGQNQIEVVALDQARLPATGEFVLWAGGNQAVIAVQNAQAIGQPGLTLRYSLSDDPTVFGEGQTDNLGRFTAVNLPPNPIELRAFNNTSTLAGFNTIQGTDAVGTVVVTTVNAPSPVDNNTFTQGLAGWNVGNAPVTLVTAANDLSPQLFADGSSGMDLVLSSGGKEGPQTISRTFTVKAGMTSVKVRFRFITGEIPGGFFGTDFNDRFSVTMRRIRAGTGTADPPRLRSGSMNQLGLSMFDAQGATSWMEESVSVTAGDTLQVELTVVNVGDSAFDSQLVVDGLFEGTFAIESMMLLDIDNNPLEMFSAAADNPYRNGHTDVNGRIRFNGKAGDRIQAIVLEVIQNGNVVANGDLDPGVSPQLLTTFTSSGVIELGQSVRLFRLPNAQAAGINVASNGTVRLRVRASTSSGEEKSRDHPTPLDLLGRFSGSNRYGSTRDENQGGDDWVLPTVRDLIGQLGSGVLVNDFSNMNGGRFVPHDSHRRGIDVDATVGSFSNKDAAAAQALIDILNGTVGSSIQLIGTTFPPVGEFAAVLNQTILDDGRNASDVVRQWADHNTHFHIRFK
jgi:hypothetical protein